MCVYYLNMKGGLVMKNKPSCPKCDSKQILTSKNTGRRWCRVCGYQWESKANGISKGKK